MHASQVSAGVITDLLPEAHVISAISRYGTVVTVIAVSAQMGGFSLVYSGTMNFKLAIGNKLD